MGLRKQPAFPIVLVLLVIATGTAGYAILKGWSLLGSLCMTVVTITTVGFEEVHSLSRAAVAGQLQINPRLGDIDKPGRHPGGHRGGLETQGAQGNGRKAVGGR